MKNRILYLDLAKFFAILFVCIGHAFVVLSPQNDSTTIGAWIYSFHMPLFMMISGFFCAHSLSRRFGNFLCYKFMQLWVPSFVIPIIQFVILGPLLSHSIPTADYVKGSVFDAVFIGGLWFLKALFCCYLYFYIVKHIPLPDWALCIGSTIIALVFPHATYVQFRYLLFFFWAGYFINKYKEKIEPHYLIITLVSLVLFVFLGRHEYPIILSYDNMLHKTAIVIWQIVTAFFGSLSVVGISFLLAKYIKSYILYKLGAIGMDTLGIYAIQSIVLTQLAATFIKINMVDIPWQVSNFVLMPLIGLIATLVCYVIVEWIRKFKWPSVLLIGDAKRIIKK